MFDPSSPVSVRRGSRGMPRAERERLILDVAGTAFARGDYHSASMDAIAELAGVSKPMLYAYFGSKEGLYVAYIDQTGRELLARLIAAGDSAAEPREQLRARIDEFFAFVEQYRDGWRVLFREAVGGAVGEEVARLREQIAQGIRDLLEQGLPAEGGRRPVALDAVAHAIVGAGESLANWWLEHPDVTRLELAGWYQGVIVASVRTLERHVAAHPARR